MMPIRSRSACTPSTVARLLIKVCLLGFAGLILAFETNAQGDMLRHARQSYEAADFDKAIELYSALAQDKALPRETRKEAFTSLGRLYVAKRLDNRAREAIAELLELEPPLVELDPEEEPYPLIRLYYEMRKEHSGSYEVERQDSGLQTLAVMDFQNYALEDHGRFEPFQWGFSSAMSNYLSGASDLKVVERERLQWVLQELDLQKEPGRVDQQTAVRIGKLLGAHIMVFGSYYVVGKKMRLEARLVKVETGEVLQSERADGKKEDPFDLIEKLSLKIAQAANVTVAKTSMGARTETKSLDAMLSFSEGLKLLDEENYRAAYEKFMEALDFDPGYQRAQRKADSIRLLLADAGELEGVLPKG